MLPKFPNISSKFMPWNMESFLFAQVSEKHRNKLYSWKIYHTWQIKGIETILGPQSGMGPRDVLADDLILVGKGWDSVPFLGLSARTNYPHSTVWKPKIIGCATDYEISPSFLGVWWQRRRSHPYRRFLLRCHALASTPLHPLIYSGQLWGQLW
jgi:hypothetical protein